MAKATRVTRARRLLLGGTAALATITIAWFGFGRPWAVRQIEARLGRALVIDWLRPTVDGFEARGVTVYGKPPFEREVLASIDSLSLHNARLDQLASGALANANLVLDGVDLQLLIAPGADNVRGRVSGRQGDGPNGAPGPHPATALSRWPSIALRNARLHGIAHLPGGRAASFRASELAADVRPGQPVAASFRNMALEVDGVVTARIPALTVESSLRGEPVIVHGKGAALAIPGADNLAGDLVVDGSWTDHGFSFLAKRAPGSASPWLSVNLRSGAGGIELDVQAIRLPLAGFAPWAEPHGIGVSDGEADVSLHAGFDAATMQIPWRIDATAAGIDLRHPSVDTAGWFDIPLRAALSGRIDVAAGKLDLGDSRAEIFGVPVALSGWSELGRKPRGNLIVASPESGLSCAHVLDRQPLPIRRALAGMKLAGRLRFRVALGFDAADWEEMGLDVSLPSLCAVVAEPDAIERNRAALLTGTPARLEGRPELPLGPAHPDFVRLAQIPKHLSGAFLTAEDSSFFTHNGFEVEAIRRALAYNLERGQLVRGASTITQQLAKNMFLSLDRTVSRKIAETVLAWRLDTLLPKHRALELYLNVLELGPGVRGVRQAARTYFGKALAELRPLESAHIASLPPNPMGYARRFRGGRVDDGWLHRLYDLLASMQRRGHISNADVTAARSTRLELRKI